MVIRPQLPQALFKVYKDKAFSQEFSLGEVRRCGWPTIFSTAFQPRLKSTISTALEPRPESSDGLQPKPKEKEKLRTQDTPEAW